MKLKKLWLELEEWERDILLYLTYGISPFSIDILFMLSARSPANLLNSIEKFKNKKIVCERKDSPKGTYYLCDHQIRELIREHVAEDIIQKAVEELIRTYQHVLNDGEEKNLTLARLYMDLGKSGAGLEYTRKAADIMLRDDRPEEASKYYNHLLRSIDRIGINPDNAEYYLAAYMGNIEITGQWIPIDEIIPQLLEARKIAHDFKCWKLLGKVNFELLWRLLLKEDVKAAAHYISANRKLAVKLSDKQMHQMVDIWQTEIYRWRGRIGEGNSRYEESVGKLEKFGDDKPSLWAGAGRGLSYVISGRVAQGLGMIEAVRLKTNLLNIMSRRLVVFVDRMLIMSLLEIRKLNEAEQYVDKMFALPGELLGFYMLRELYLFRAYLYCNKGEYEQAFDNHCKAVGYSRYGGFVQQIFPWSFEYMDALEKQGFIHEEMNYDSEIERVLGKSDIYMKGVGLRYRAMRNMEQQQSWDKVLPDLLKSEKLLSQAGAEIELARTRITLGRASLKKEDIKNAQTYLEKAWIVFAKIDKELFPQDLQAYLPNEKRGVVVIDRLITINESLGVIREKTPFINQVISAALDFTMATRAAFFRVEAGREPWVLASKNIDPLFFKTAQFQQIKKIVAQAAYNVSERVIPGLNGENAVTDWELSLDGITSLICMPVKLYDKVHGYMYIGNRFSGGSFTEIQLYYLRLLCSQMAVGLSNIEAYEDIRGLKERYQDEAGFYKREMGIVINPLETIVGASKGITAVKEAIRQVAPTDSSVLIMGETGVGKELVAKAVHNLSSRKDGPFIPVNLAAIPPELFVSELFGHEKGAFTGAMEQYKGRFELANGGTIFLDEIGDLPLNVQVRLLRVLQEGSFERLGSSKPIHSDFRVVVATNKNLADEVDKGAFRRDLYYRLNVFPILVPPLRERVEDIRPLTQHFLTLFSRKMRKKIRRISAEDLCTLMNYTWPGNVRELKHSVERAVVLCDDNNINFSEIERAALRLQPGSGTLLSPMADAEREHIEKTLNATHWRVKGPKGAALILGLKPSTLFARMKKLGISRG